jgi:hypothetical protein
VTIRQVRFDREVGHRSGEAFIGRQQRAAKLAGSSRDVERVRATLSSRIRPPASSNTPSIGTDSRTPCTVVTG